MQKLLQMLSPKNLCIFPHFVCGAAYIRAKGEAEVAATFNPLSRCSGFEHIKGANPREWS